LAKQKLVARIKGGLGNQLYCYAAARRLAWVNNVELVLDHISGFARDAEYQRKYRLDGFSIPARLVTPGERYEPFERFRRGVVKLLNRRLPFERRTYIEQEFPDFDPRVLDLRLQAGTTVIDGLWQSAHYFADIEEMLRADLRITPPVDARNLDAQAWIKQHRAVSVHVRWFASPAAESGATTNVHAQYYLSALSMIRERIYEPYFAVFSDDPHAAAAMLDLPKERTLLVDWNSGEGGELADLWLMSSCEHYVVANSTFSWWGAWLGARSDDQLVLFPRCAPRDALGWAWDYEGQMPAAWLPVPIVP
jgi:hypothetical protein